MRRLLKWIGFLIGVIIVLLAGVLGFFYFKSQTAETGTLHLKGLQGEVTITRDQYGIPHIVAQKSDLDAFYALGYVHAQDRFWQMEFQRRVVQGTLSEIFGPATLKQDEYLRTWGFYRAAKTSWQSLSPQAKAIVQAYTDGVNAFLAQKHYPLQIQLLHYQPKPWTNIDSIAWQKMLAWDLQNTWKLKLKNYVVAKKLGEDQIPVIFPPYPKDGTTILSDADLKQSGIYSENVLQHNPIFENARSKGSNNWVVSGKWTTSHKPMLANDPHLGLQSPALWYLADIKGPGLHVIGATLPGVPVVVIGHNDHIAWGVTNVNPDVQDLYILPKNAPVHVINEVIKVRGKPDVIFPVRISSEGPIISDVTEAGQIGDLVALKWTALMPDDKTVQSMVEINYATNWQQFTDALKDFTVPSQNFVYADTSGNIGYYVPGKIPLRDWDSGMPIPDDAAHQWNGYIPFNQLPHVYNPPEEYIVSANNRVVSDHYGYPMTFRWNDPPYRAQRIVELLKANRPLNNQKFEKIQMDTVSLLWESMSPILLKTKPLNSESKIALKLLRNWNGDSNLDSEEKTIFAYWYRDLGKMTPAPVAALSSVPDPLFIQQQLETNGKYCQIEGAKNCDEFLSLTLQQAMQQLAHDHGTDPSKWDWKYVHHAVFPELGLGTVKGLSLIWNRSIPTPGGLFTVDVGTYDHHFNQTDGASYRQIVDLGDLNNSVFIQTLGQSEDVFSKHYDDEMPLWRDGKYLPMTSDPKEFGKTKVLILKPRV